jgi:hypothetical protein
MPEAIAWDKVCGEVAFYGSPCKAAVIGVDHQPRGMHPAPSSRRDFLGVRDDRAVIVLTLKPFGETLEAPPTEVVMA